MCGLAGFLLKGDLGDPEGVLRAMSLTLIHRGPDDQGLHFDPSLGLGLAHRRLSIIDLSPSGRQPMLSTSGRYRMVYNGEIYNYKALRSDLGRNSKNNGDGDSALILDAFDGLGVEQALKRFRGMFALAIHDLQENRLLLARDTVGIKPLYYGWTPSGTFLFGSELKALEVHPHFEGRVDPGAVNLLMRFGNIPQPHSIYEGVYKLPPGYLLSVSLDEETGVEVVPVPFRSTLDCAKKGWENPFSGNRDEAREELHGALRASVKEHMVADVPLGAFLSGGVDSSLVCALAQEAEATPLKVFTIGFEESAFDEHLHARKVAQHLGLEHHERMLSSTEMSKRLPDLLSHLDEPFADSSYLPTFMVSGMTREHVTVSMSGDGGDELYGGYDRYQWAPAIWKARSRLPKPLRRCLAALGERVSLKHLNAFSQTIHSILPNSLKLSRFGSRFKRVAALLDSTSPRELYMRLMTHSSYLPRELLGVDGPSTLLDGDELWDLRDDMGEKMMLHDLMMYLSDDILTKVDRASMSVGLESRTPLLTPELVELAWSFPPAWRREKSLLKEILYGYVPRDIIDRPKMGFGVPVGEWMRGPLRNWVEDLFVSKLAVEGEWFDHSALMKVWAEHLSCRGDRSHELWNVLCFLHWKNGR